MPSEQQQDHGFSIGASGSSVSKKRQPAGTCNFYELLRGGGSSIIGG
jgi:hypothetical protein